MKAMFAKPHRSKLRACPQIAVRLGSNVSVNYRAIDGHRDLQFVDIARSVKEFPVFIGLDSLVPSNLRDGFTPSEKRITDHVTPADGSDTLAFAAMHPDAFAIHQQAEHHRSTTATLPDGKNV